MSWIPGWDSVDGAGSWSHFWFWFGILCLFALGASEIVSHVYSLRKDQLVAAADRASAEQRERETNEAEARRKAETEALQKQLAEADKKVAELDRLRTPRHLSDAQKAKLTASLAGQPTGELVMKASGVADDARAYAGEIAAFFQALGWRVRIDNALLFGSDVSGIWLSINDSNAVPPATSALHHALESAGFPVRKTVTGDPSIPANEIWLSIGAKK